ncbi:hypothetical protein BDR07DRAFT_1376609 [Suillus spraguei]|nr:hypothetical protein BDR07DRAFT_1376609 [Suillus spraguei]
MLMGMPQMFAMWVQEFHKFGKKISTMMNIAAAHFGFEGSLVVCGKVANQDGSLGMAHMTAGAAGFWLTHCKANDDTIVGHLKAQVYNLMSLGAIEEPFKDEVIIPKHNQSEAPTTGEITKECLDILKNGIQWIKQELARQIEQLGGQLSSKRNFPWKTLPAELIHLRMVIKGYPEDILLPGKFHTMANKGIANLKETRIFVAALKAGTMRFKKAPEAIQAKLVTSEIPIIEGKPPAVDSIHAGGHRLFANRKSDCLGLPRAKLSATATRQKAPTTLHTSPISLFDDNHSDDNNSDANPSTICPTLKLPPSCKFDPSAIKPHPSCQFKVMRLPKSQVKDEKDEKKIVKKNVKNEVISLVSSEVSNAHSSSEKFEVNDRAESDSDCDYEDNSSVSKKQKAKSEVTLQASKKRIPSSKASLPKVGHLKSTKRKGKALAEKSKQPFTVESSDDEEALDITVQGIQPVRHLRDGPTAQGIVSLTASLQFTN